MKKITRTRFLKQTIGMGTLAILNPFDINLFAKTDSSQPLQPNSKTSLYKKMVAANDGKVKKIKDSLKSEIKYLGRALGYDFAILSAAYSEPTSSYHEDEELPNIMSKIIDVLMEEQMADGTLDFGNLGSPPDTAFMLEPLCTGAHILLKYNPERLKGLKAKTKEFITKAADGLAKGGVHTANHRWVVSAALAKINALYPNDNYTARIKDWLGEGIYNDKNGHFQERSKIYSEVIDRSLITISRLQDMPELLNPVRKNLRMTYYYMEPNGDLITFDSRRQDKSESRNIIYYYHHYRYLAIKDSDGEFASITKFIENLNGFEDVILNNSLFYFMENPLLKQELPKLVPPPVNYEKFFETTDLARIRHGDTTATIFGGVDWPLIIASGRSTSPNFFSFRKGSAGLKYMRMSAGFFSTGYFRSDGLQKNGNKYILSKELKVPYYQPLSEDKRKSDGNYKLSRSIDGRFWNKMDFEDRPISNVKNLKYTVTIVESGQKMELFFDVKGTSGVPITIELCFKEGGELVGTAPANDHLDNNFLKKGMGKYKSGDDTITFGPGIFEHQKIKDLAGEMYTSHFGSLRTEGTHVYLTGKTPFEHKMTIQ